MARMTHLLDSTILVDYVREHRRAVDFVEGLSRKPSISVVSVQELYSGAHSAGEEAQIEMFLGTPRILPVTIAIARSAGLFMRHYAPSHGLDDLDAIIAATAEHHGLDLATLNVKHFPMFRRLKRAY
jgi:predicted nucleic acid-binding protein